MSTLIIQDALADRLKAIAEQENRPVEAVLADLLDRYLAAPTDEQIAALAAMDGMFDDDVTDLSTTISGSKYPA